MLYQHAKELLNVLAKLKALKEKIKNKRILQNDFEKHQQEYYERVINAKIKIITNAIGEVKKVSKKKADELSEYTARLKQELNKQELEKAIITAEQLVDVCFALKEAMPKQQHYRFALNAPLPEAIKHELLADLEEIKKCFANQCYRSCVIMTGRMLETALHRKYYEITGNDLLEKAPGIGLGNLVARLAELKVKLDPAIMQQVHLINQVRIFSVHKKRQPFKPSREQTLAIILYTLDIIKKLFEK